jgi:tRNA-2-methylthio-N6-dimethylallyladenosine synthase
LAEKKRRLHAVEEVQAQIALELNQSYIGKIQDVMVEEMNVSHGRRQWKGRNRANKWVFFPEPDADQATGHRIIQPGDFVNVRIEQATAWSLQGCAVAV